MDNEIISVIAEQLINEFPCYEKDFYQTAKRLYSIMRLDDEKESTLAAIREVLKKLE